VIEEACNRLLGRASNARGLRAEDITGRVREAVEKYLCRDGSIPEKSAVRAFIDEMRADDLCLIIACERGDDLAWEELVDNYDVTVKSAARKICGNIDAADDLAGSIWAELHGLKQDAQGSRKGKLAYYSGRGSLAGWLRAVVSQMAVDHFRKDSRFVHIEENREFENLADAASNNSNNSRAAAHTESPEELFSNLQTGRDVSAALKSAIESLDAEDRLILKLYYFEDLKLKEIARAFGYHEATASRKLARLHSEIRKKVEKQLREDHGWSDTEIKHYLSDAAAKLGTSVERLFGVLLVAAVVQDLLV
jgi:RNA polymerase sigma-70 factor (ECF subfamily)